jgi:hypothetical protein
VEYDAVADAQLRGQGLGPFTLGAFTCHVKDSGLVSRSKGAEQPEDAFLLNEATQKHEPGWDIAWHGLKRYVRDWSG